MNNPYPYFAQLMSKGQLPIEICDYILSFSDEIVPVVCSKDMVPVGWFYYSVPFKHLSEIVDESELDLCKKCKIWRKDCSCKRKNKPILLNTK